MANAGGDEKSLDGLEIISIGRIYIGPLEKKYWSSSRGKDRYPYPIGYNAVRTQNGITYKMEILEGLKGPLFTISSTDGKSCSGQTPDIAWERFQKKGSTQIKLWHGKRFSCKIDGVEFFGFRNAFVQRLLRELVANVNGTVEQNFPPSSFHDGATETRNQPQSAESTSYTDLLPHLAKTRITGKRSRKDKVINVKSVRVDVQKLCSDGNRNSDAPESIEISTDFCASDKKHESSSSPRAPAGPLNLEGVTMKEVRLPLTERDSKLDTFDISGNPNVNDLSQEPTRSSGSISFEAVEDGRLNTDKELLGCSKSSESQFLNNRIVEETQNSDHQQTVTYSDICAPDTFDLPPDDSSDSTTKITSEAAYNVKDGDATNRVASEVLVTESPPEDAGSSIPDSCSEKSDVDLFGQEIANPMMTLLLPRAVPLLNTYSRRKKNVKSSKDFQSNGGNNIPGLRHNFPSTVAEHMEDIVLENQDNVHPPNSHSAVQNCGHMDSVVPDSFDNDETGLYLGKQLQLYSDATEVDPAHFSRDPCMKETSDLAVRVNTKDICLKSIENPHSGNIHCGKVDLENLPDSCKDESCDANLAERNNSLCVPPLESSLDSRSLEMTASGFPVVAADSMIMCTAPVEGVLQGDRKATSDSKITANPHNLPASKGSEVSFFCQISSGGCVQSNVTQQSLNDLDLAADNSVAYLPDHGISNAASKGVKQSSYLKAQAYSEHSKLLGSYVHPMPISMVLLRIKETEIYIFALCGISEHEEKTLFVYKAPIDGENMGCPSFIGHVLLVFPSSKDGFGREVVLEKSSLQLTPDAKCLVLLNCIKAPYCREGNIHCPCESCKADHWEKSAVNIVEVKDGFISVVTKLKTSKRVSCILVCEPSYLIAAEESGRLYLWLMNSSWSAKIEECCLPTHECLPPCPVELKKIPKSTALVLGHNGFGEFCLWDIYKRILVSKFTAPGTTVYQCIPVGFFRWQKKGIYSADIDVQEFTNGIMDSTKKWFSEMNENQVVSPTDVEDVAIWLLTSSGADLQNGHVLSELHTGSIEGWKLALMIKDMMIVGSAIDPRAVTVGALLSHGIIGRDDGLVYMCDLFTGINLGSFHHFKGERVSCIATEDSGSGAFAIASDGGQLRIYLHTQGSH